MGQKTNPISLRLRLNRDFDSSWYHDLHYGELFTKELQLRKYISTVFTSLNIYEGRIIIHIFPKKIDIFYFYMNRPRGFSRASLKVQNPKIRGFIKKKAIARSMHSTKTIQAYLLKKSFKRKILYIFMNHLLFFRKYQSQETAQPIHQIFFSFALFEYLIHQMKNVYSNSSLLPRLSTLKVALKKGGLLKSKENLCDGSDEKVTIYPLKLHSKTQSAHFIAHHVANALKRKKSFREIFKFIQKDVMKDSSVLGIRIQCSGRIGGVEMARVETRKYGQTSLHTFAGNIDYANSEALTSAGMVGIKVWLSVR